MKKSADNKSLNLLDTVALLRNLPESNLVKGQVGTIVEELDDKVFEVEFADRKGKTISCLSIKADDLMLLHFELENAM